jgi:hypothetical protein
MTIMVLGMGFKGEAKGDDKNEVVRMIGPIKARRIIFQNWESIPHTYRQTIGIFGIPFAVFFSFMLSIELLNMSVLQAIIVICLGIAIPLFLYGYIWALIIIKKYNLKVLDQLDLKARS